MRGEGDYNIFILMPFSCFGAIRSFLNNEKIPDNRSGSWTPPQSNFSQKHKFDIFFEAFPKRDSRLVMDRPPGKLIIFLNFIAKML